MPIDDTDAAEIDGRAVEIDALRARLARATEGRGALVVLAGEAGIGKSALAGVLASEAEARGLTVVRGRAWEFAEAPAYFPLWPCLRALGLDDLANKHATPAGDADAFRLWERVLQALARATAAQTVVWVLEDLHAADAQTLDLLLFLAQPLRALRALVVVTLRPHDPRLEGPARARIGRLLRDSVHLELGPLSREAVEALASRVAGRPLGASAATALLARTGGNPFFVLECARAMRAAGPGAGGLAALPPTVLPVVLERVESLPTSTRETLAAAAVLGRQFDAATLARMAATLPAAVIDTLLPAVRTGILLEEQPGRFRFAHALVREAIYEATPATRRTAEHARAEAALAARGEEPEVLVDRAQHALAGLAPGREAAALALAERAVELLERSGAYDRAHALYARALESRRTAASLAPPGPRELLRLATLAHGAGAYAESRTHAERALAQARASGDAANVARAALVLGANLRPGMVDTTLVRHLEEARALLGQSEPGLRCRVEARLAAALQPASDVRVPVAMARAAISEARAAGDPELLCEVLYHGGSALIDYVDVAETRALGVELLGLALARGDWAKAVRAHVRIVMADVEAGDFATLDADLARMLELAQSLGHPRLVWRPLLLASMVATARGDFADAERFVVQVEQLAGLTDDPALATTLVGHKLARSLVLHRADEALAHGADFAATLYPGPSTAAFRALLEGFVYGRVGDRDGAAAALARVPFDHPALAVDLMSQGLVVEACVIAGTEAQRRQALGWLTPAIGREVTGGHVTVSYEGPVLRLVGLLEGAVGELAAGEAHLREALALSRARALRPWVARIGFELGQLVLLAGRTDEACGLFDDAAALAEALGITDLAARARRARADATTTSAPPPSSSRAPVVEPAAAPTAPAGFALRADGELWAVSHAGRGFRVRDSRGMQLLARLLERAGEEIHVLALASDAGDALADSDAGEALDARATQAYRARLTDLDGEIAEAEAHADLARRARLVHEREFLVQEIARAVGLGGTARRAGSASERARVNVQRRLKDAIARIGAVDPAAGRYLEAAVRTGTYCSFRH